MNTNDLTIPNQVRLPPRIALEVVLQGLRIRLGRSIVTITGVICGIAFLMSILTGQLVKQGVAAEDARREEVARMLSFVRSDLPKLRDRTVGVIGSGSLSEVETRLLEAMTAEGIGRLLFLDEGAPIPRRTIGRTERGTAAQLAATAVVIFVMGDRPPPAFDWRGYFDTSLNAMAALTSDAQALPIDSSRQIRLARDWTPEEREAKEREAGQERFRSLWIIVISLLVTVIGIANAMLMSVTERFREIGTMKCLGALSGFVTQMFVMEASIMGLVGGLFGALLGILFAITVYAITYGGGLIFASMPLGLLALYGLGSIFAGVVLSIIAALYPARVAASMVPATALRSTI